MKLPGCGAERVVWFTSRGYLVVLALRRGYGENGGTWAESFGGCAKAAFYEAGLETARDIDATISYATTLPYARPFGVVVVGHSAGGFGTVAYDSMRHERVVAMINMAGGRGGHENQEPNRNCRPDRLVDAIGNYGPTATTPMLWIYAENDTYFSPELARSMHERYVARGGTASLHELPAFGREGHDLFSAAGGGAIWGPIVEKYLEERFAETD